jgi:hypothetical protein
MNQVAPYGKAITAAIISGLSMLSGFLINDTALGDITAGQWIAVVISFLVGLGAVWAIPNTSEPTHPPIT